MGLDEQMLVPAESPLVAFDGTRVFPKGIAHGARNRKDSASELPCNRE